MKNGRGKRDIWGRWECNYKEGCKKSSYYHTTCIEGRRGRHVYICPKHLTEYLGFNTTGISN